MVLPRCSPIEKITCVVSVYKQGGYASLCPEQSGPGQLQSSLFEVLG